MKVDKKFLKETVRELLSQSSKEESALLDTSTKLDILSRLYRENKTFRNIVLNPKLPFEEKEKVLERIKEILHLNDSVYSILKKIVALNKVNILKEIGTEFKFEVEKFFATLKGEIIAAHPIDDDLLSKIRQTVEAKLGKKVEFNVKEDPSLIAGAVIRAGSYVIDTSVKSYLKKLEQQLSRF
ncbi:MAG: ATP synthase F1 subunit delta [Hydrogenothermaceae bacterium]|nr:ATP synthase F1 subunit delta [Hydrogenothermaceae bacterium]